MTVRSQLAGSTVLHEQNITTLKLENKIIPKRPILFHYRSNNLFVFFTASFALFTSSFVHSILFSLSPFILRTNDLYPKEAGILVSFYGLGLLVGSPLFGCLGDKQRRLPMLLGSVLCIMANIFFMISINYPMLLVARFLQGFGNASVWTLCLCLIADHWPKEHLGAQMGKLVGFYPIGMITGLPIGKILYNELGHQAPFIVSIIFCTLDFIFRVLLVERNNSPSEWQITSSDIEKSKATSHHNRINSTNSGDEGLYDASSDISSMDDNSVMDAHENDDKKVTWRSLLKQPRLLVSLVVTVMIATVMTAFEPTLILTLVQDWQLNVTQSSFVVLAYLLPCIIASNICGWLCDIYGSKIIALLSLLLATPFCILIGVPSHAWGLMPVLVMSGVTFAGCQAPIFPEIAKIGMNGLAKSFSLFNAAYGIGMSLGPLMAGFLYGSIGFLWLCVILSMLPLVCIPFVYLFMGENQDLTMMVFKNTVEPAIEQGQEQEEGEGEEEEEEEEEKKQVDK